MKTNNKQVNSTKQNDITQERHLIYIDQLNQQNKKNWWEIGQDKTVSQIQRNKRGIAQINEQKFFDSSNKIPKQIHEGEYKSEFLNKKLTDQQKKQLVQYNVNQPIKKYNYKNKKRDFNGSLLVTDLANALKKIQNNIGKQPQEQPQEQPNKNINQYDSNKRSSAYLAIDHQHKPSDEQKRPGHEGLNHRIGDENMKELRNYLNKHSQHSVFSKKNQEYLENNLDDLSAIKNNDSKKLQANMLEYKMKAMEKRAIRYGTNDNGFLRNAWNKIYYGERRMVIEEVQDVYQKYLDKIKERRKELGNGNQI